MYCGLFVLAILSVFVVVGEATLRLQLHRTACHEGFGSVTTEYYGCIRTPNDSVGTNDTIHWISMDPQVPYDGGIYQNFLLLNERVISFENCLSSNNCTTYETLPYYEKAGDPRNASSWAEIDYDEERCLYINGWYVEVAFIDGWCPNNGENQTRSLDEECLWSFPHFPPCFNTTMFSLYGCYDEQQPCTELFPTETTTITWLATTTTEQVQSSACSTTWPESVISFVFKMFLVDLCLLICNKLFY